MNEHTHQTAPTQFVEANGIRFAYRRFGKADGVPIVFNQHYVGTMDYWDPAVTDGLARDREVILFNNAGISSSSGEVPTTFEQMGANAVAFSRALGLNKVDVLGFSIGGMVAQEITLQAPDLVRKLILVGTGPRGGQGMEPLTLVAQRIFGAAYDPPEHLWLAVLFSPSEAGQAAGGEFLKRKHLRQQGRDPEVNDKVSLSQIEAMDKWGVQQEGSYGYLKTIKQPTLVVNGSNDAHAHGQLLHHGAEHPERAAGHLPRLQSRIAVSISRAVCAAHFAVPGRMTVHDVGPRRHTGREIEGVSHVGTCRPETEDHQDPGGQAIRRHLPPSQR
jgi:pimeloyl-ACP methyl ester carboxylesterase